MAATMRAPTIMVRKRVYQKEGDGLCFSACIASLMGVSLSDVPCFWEQDGDRKRRVDMSQSAKRWLRECGYVWWELKWDRDDLGTQHDPVPSIVSGESPRGIMHAIVCEFFTMPDTKQHAVQMIHDPHPSGAGIKEPLWIGWLLPLQHSHRSSTEHTESTTPNRAEG